MKLHGWQDTNHPQIWKYWIFMICNKDISTIYITNQKLTVNNLQVLSKTAKGGVSPRHQIIQKFHFAFVPMALDHMSLLIEWIRNNEKYFTCNDLWRLNNVWTLFWGNWPSSNDTDARRNWSLAFVGVWDEVVSLSVLSGLDALRLRPRDIATGCW